MEPRQRAAAQELGGAPRGASADAARRPRSRRLGGRRHLRDEADATSWGEEKVQPEMLKYLYERVSTVLDTAGHSGILIADQPPGDRTDEKRWLGQALALAENGTQYIAPDLNRIVLPVLTARSDHLDLLQLADLVTAATTALIAGSEHAAPYRDLIMSLLAKNPTRSTRSPWLRSARVPSAAGPGPTTATGHPQWPPWPPSSDRKRSPPSPGRRAYAARYAPASPLCVSARSARPSSVPSGPPPRPDRAGETASCPTAGCWSNGPRTPGLPPNTGCPACRPTPRSPTWSGWPRSAGASSTTTANSSTAWAWTTSKAGPGPAGTTTSPS